MNPEQTITREIGIDAGHRVTLHESKCKNLHGHRYTIQATCRGRLIEQGPSSGMVLDFGFLKEEMMTEIDAPCDHGLILWVDDPLAVSFTHELLIHGGFPTVREVVADDGYLLLTNSMVGKLYIVPFAPTAENLARHWFYRLEKKVLTRSSGSAILSSLRVYETPNCWADYSP